MIFIKSDNSKSTGFYKPFFPITIPYGVGYLISTLRTNNIPCYFIDQQVTRDVLLEVKNIVNNISKPYIFCLSTISEAFPSTIKLSKLLKEEYPNSIIICGGLHASINPTEFLSESYIDYIFQGEAENTISDIYHSISKNIPLTSIQGIGYIDSGKVKLNPPASPIDNLDNIPMQPYDLFYNKGYNLGYIITSRGCVYNCKFCCNNIISQNKYRFRSSENIIQELDILINKYQQKSIAFFDDNFLANKSRIYELCSKIRGEKLNHKSTFMFQSRCRDIDGEIIKELKASGFNTVFFGIETISENLLKNIGKNETTEQIKSAVNISKKEGFKVIANFIFGLPEESHQDRMKSVDFSIEHDIDIVKFNNLVPYPGTDIYKNHGNDSGFNMLSDFSNANSQLTLVQPFWKRIVFPYVPVNTTNKEIRNDILFSYLKFYFRFHRIRKILFRKRTGEVLFSLSLKKYKAFKKILFLIILFFDLSIKVITLFFSNLFSKKKQRY